MQIQIIGNFCTFVVTQVLIILYVFCKMSAFLSLAALRREAKEVRNMEFPENESTILGATLSLHPKSKSFHVSVSKKCITVRPATTHQRQRDSSTDGGSFHQIQLADVIGCECAKGKASSDQNAYLNIFAYPHVKKFGSKKTARQRQVRTLIFDEGKDFQVNNATAIQWKAVICNLLRNIEITRSEGN